MKLHVKNIVKGLLIKKKKMKKFTQKIKVFMKTLKELAIAASYATSR